MKISIAICTILILLMKVKAQDKTLPFNEIQSAPEKFTAGTVASRMVDGLGFRYYWATESLRAQDLAFKPSAEARTVYETLEHIYEMSILILNATTQTANLPGQAKKLSFEEMRKVTLENFRSASKNLLAASDEQMKKFNFIFKEQNRTIEFPFWNMINGPIEDCVWHVGQIVSFRRSSGNPINGKAEVFTGTLEK